MIVCAETRTYKTPFLRRAAKGRKMKKTMIIICLATMFAWCSQAQASWMPSAFKISTTAFDKYLGTNGVVFHGDPVLQTSFWFDWDNGAYAEIWHSVGLDGTDMSSDYGDEWDGTVGLKKLFCGDEICVLVDVSLAYFELFELGKVPQGDVLQPQVVLSIPTDFFGSTSPYVKVKAPIGLAGESADWDGWHFHAGVWQAAPKGLYPHSHGDAALTSHAPCQSL